MTEKKSATTRLGEATSTLEHAIAPDASVGIRELRDHLSRYLERVKAGATVSVTDHGRVIATIVPMTYSKHVLELAAQGLVRLPTRPPIRAADIPKIDVDGVIFEHLRDVRL